MTQEEWERLADVDLDELEELDDEEELQVLKILKDLQESKEFDASSGSYNQCNSRYQKKRCENVAKYILQSYPYIDLAVCVECMPKALDYFFVHHTSYVLVRKIGGYAGPKPGSAELPDLRKPFGF